MRRLDFYFAALLVFCSLLLAGITSGQTLTNVSATISDPNGLPYSNAIVQIQLVPAGGPSPHLTPCNNSQVGCPLSQPSPGRANAAGFFQTSLYANASILPASTQWQFTVTEPGVAPPIGTGPQSFSVSVTVSGSSQDLSSTLSAAAPALAHGLISAGVASFNTRTGAVTSQTGDYSFSQISGLVTNAQLTSASTTVNGQTCTLGSSCTIALTGVTSFNSRTGAVVPATSDYSFSQISGLVTNAQLTNASTTVNGQTCTLGSSCTTNPATVTNCFSNAAPAACGSAKAGAFVIGSGFNTAQINTTGVTANSEIFVSVNTALGPVLGATCDLNLGDYSLPAIVSQTAGTGFSVQLLGAVFPGGLTGCFSYLIAN